MLLALRRRNYLVSTIDVMLTVKSGGARSSSTDMGERPGD